MINALKNTAKRACFIVAASLIVAAFPATASAEQLNPAPQSDAVATAADTKTDTTNGTATTTAPVPNTPDATTTPPTATSQQPTLSANDTSSSTTTASPTPPTSQATTDTSLASANGATVNNATTSTATSGDATVVNNTTADNATTGSASVSATSINLLQSSTSLARNNVATFTTDIKGNQVGDVLIDPSKILTPSVTNAQPPATNLTVTTQNSGQINNSLTLDAQSGNATVANNGLAGDAVTGNANAVVNVVNMINSVVGANQSFIGTINIYGDLNGDILLPDNAMQSLSAQQSTAAAGNLNLATATNQQITNNVDLAATSGDASVDGNGAAGNATTGNAKTNVTIMNLVGQQLVGQDAVLVFVNVLGTWMGFIVGAPSGSTTAMVGGGPVSSSPTGSTTVNSTNTALINNTITAKATSGDATVANNGTAGNATSGNASASANILNMSNDTISLGDWFGILFINVFGSWEGAFGQNTNAGDLPADPPAAGVTTPTPSQPSAAPASTSTPHQSFVLAAQTDAGAGAGTTNDSQPQTPQQAVLGATTHVVVPHLHKTGTSWGFLAEGLGLSALLVALERLLAFRKAHAHA